MKLTQLLHIDNNHYKRKLRIDELSCIVEEEDEYGNVILKFRITEKLELKSKSYLDFCFEYDFIDFIKTNCNGFQSWSETKSYGKGDQMKTLRPIATPIWNHYKMQYYGNYNAKHNRENNLHSYHYISIERESGHVLIGDLNEQRGFGIFIPEVSGSHLIVRKEINPRDHEFELNLFISRQIPHVAFRQYAEALDIDLIPRIKTGWTSWYNYYTDIDQEIIGENLNHFINNKIPIDVFQIDDGWQKAVGDWELNTKFIDGLQSISTTCKHNDITAGLWMAPFICEEDSDLYRNHPDWIKQKDGRFVIAGYSPGWSGNFYVLNWRHPSFQHYLTACFDKVINDWGFEVLKLDFLYAVTLGLEYETQGAEMVEAMSFLGRITKGAAILACGVPLSPCFRNSAYCRVSSDVALVWEDYRLSHVLRYRERVSTLNALRSNLHRVFLNGQLLNNDPDVFILRSENHKLNWEQQKTLFILNQATGNLVFTSDDISKYTSKQMDLYLMQFPKRKYQLLDAQINNDYGWLKLGYQSFEYLVVYNLNSKQYSSRIPQGDWKLNGKLYQGEILLAGYQSKVLFDAKLNKVQMQYSDGHLFPGSELEAMNIEDGILNIKLSNQIRRPIINYTLRTECEIEEVMAEGYVIEKLEKGHERIKLELVKIKSK